MGDMMAEYRFILYETNDAIARITLNRPRYRNVQSTELLHELDHAILRAGEFSWQKTALRTREVYDAALRAFSHS